VIRNLVAATAAAAFLAGSPAAQTGAIESALRATVFLRIIGDVDAEPTPENIPAGGQGLHLRNVEIATGSGVLISSLGQILTCRHVVSDGERTGSVDGKKATVTVRVRRIEATLPAAAGGDVALAAEPYPATVVASSADLDIAVLSISGANLPAADLGDSDALEPGDGLDTVGFPFGQDVEIGRPLSARTGAPGATISHGDFSAFRTDTQGLRRFIQTSAAVNPGNSGGPIVDVDGYVVGIVSRRLTASGGGAGIGFAVPVNLVKEFLEVNGLDGQLAARRLALGPTQPFTGKGLRARLPWGVSDVSPLRARVDTGGQPTAIPVLRIDRVVSAWDAPRLAAAMTRQRALDPFAPAGAAVERIRSAGGRSVLAGRITGTWPDGSAARMEYAVIDIGQEKILARYVGAANVIAYNASIFRASLASIEAEALRRPGGSGARPAGWVPALTGGPASILSGLPLPAGWLQEPDGPLPCEGLPAPADAVAASPPGDFLQTVRASVVRRTGLTAADAAAACGQVYEDQPEAYQRALASFGTRLFVRGRFIQVGPDELLHYEVVGPAEQQAALQDVLGLWAGRIAQAWRRPGE
jgi:S1-C subfamily serine protease